ncbi:uncharacterized protein LOC129780428 isoform X2 [Toxorhynchites rutilus septentrionalis]|uniref:uncharacterized protein LOC129780428 isoform X2 n=1 Tax=Toxorhynchites rutilus septentrionalis TaxID=329112 RepID=UPI002478DE9F|nr:uncharacterized protein LOC129780428 isoform X2 [Toxorhynchites rutilus septentrionalis]
MREATFCKMKSVRCKCHIFASVLVLLAISTITGSIQIDNRLVQPQHDCFERIALGAMLPFEKTFRNSDTNSLKICETLCLNDKECQTFAFGISGRGNGTCQLSANVIDATNSRPLGTIFDPDFDLYSRKYNCFLDTVGPSNPPPRPGGLGSFPASELPPGGTQRPTAQFPPSGPIDRPGPPVFTAGGTTTVGESQSSSNGGFTDPTRPTSEYPSTFSTSVGSTFGQPTAEVVPETTAPGEEYYTTKEQPSSTLPGNHYTPPTNTAYGPSIPTGGNRYPPKQPGPPTMPGESPTKYPLDFRPQYPPASGPSRPEIYAQNVPTFDGNYLRPEYAGYFGRPSAPSAPTGSTKPVDNNVSGYGGTGPQRPTDNRPIDYGGTLRPSGSGSAPGSPSYGVTRPPPSPIGPSGNDGYRVTEDKHDLYPAKLRPCYRRVLAGKRVAPQWVRRTLVCERVEDCQRECADERRFPCEGFNYRLDPTGRGQGDCELIDQPLSQIDLYSSPHQRDSNLIRDPDYDYYERDRSASPSCRTNYGCKDCSVKTYRPPLDFVRPTTYRPHADGYKPFPPERSPFEEDRYKPGTAIDKYRPPIYSRPDFDRYGTSYYPPPPPSSDSYRPALPYKPHYGGDVDRYETIDNDRYKPPPHGPLLSSSYDRLDYFRPPYSYPGDNRPTGHRPRHPYEDRDPPPPPAAQYPSHGEKTSTFIPYLIGQDVHKNWGTYGGSYGHSGTDSYKSISDYWGIRNEIKRYDGPSFNYFELRNEHHPDENIIWTYGGRKYGYDDTRSLIVPEHRPDRVHFVHQWTRRPGHDDCSVKSSEGFRLHKGVVKYALNTPTVIECERMCYTESRFRCHTFSYRYSTVSRENCLLCDRPYNLLDFYADLEPDRDYDIYSMTDDTKTCQPESHPTIRDINAQCFLRTTDSYRFFKAIVRDSLTVRSVGECELECIRATKFTCRAFTYSFGPHTINSVIDNCQLSDWPVRDMDRERHLVFDEGFDVFERASYGQGCEIQPIIDDKHHKKFCYLGYGSPAKLLSSAIKKVISVSTELDCKNECVRLRETTPFKCLSFSYSSQASTYNCEMSDLDQSELKLGVHYAHTNDRDYWLFAWNPFDYTCRDKIITISGGGTRMNHDRRMDIFREPGDGSWRQYTVSGKPCRLGTKCERNKITGFYSCELEGGEVGSWDYCCKYDHPCGYSQGFEYPWCFVGDAPDQWRKCSDKYFPKKPHQHPNGITDDSGHQDKNKKGEVYQPPPKPGGLRHLDDVTAPAELWPVTFLYDKGPPLKIPKPTAANVTELSSNVIDCRKDKC